MIIQVHPKHQRLQNQRWKISSDIFKDTVSGQEAKSEMIMQHTSFPSLPCFLVISCDAQHMAISSSRTACRTTSSMARKRGDAQRRALPWWLTAQRTISRSSPFGEDQRNDQQNLGQLFIRRFLQLLLLYIRNHICLDICTYTILKKYLIRFFHLYVLYALAIGNISTQMQFRSMHGLSMDNR